MKMAVIGSGKVGGALATQFAKAKHEVFVGVRDTSDEKAQALASSGIVIKTIPDAVKEAEVVVIAVNASAAKDVAGQLGDVSNKIIIDVMNTFGADVAPYHTTAEALLHWTNCPDVVKCFNTTGFANMADPVYEGQKIDLFSAGSSKKGKEIAAQLAKEIGFGEVYDLGGNDAFVLQEQLAVIWVTMAMKQGYDRNIAFKVLKR